ncbi:hypothetical protein F5148DRAFT_975182, partial [Russula earlei]
YARAVKAELAKDLDTAFRLYVEAGSAYLKHSRAVAYVRAQEQARKDAARALGRAERIKAIKPDLAPVWRDPFASEEQQRVLKDDSVINRINAPLWTTPSQELGAAIATQDPDGLLELSPQQKEVGVLWRRPSEVLASAKVFVFSSDLRPEDIAQRVVADCSLCASIVVSLWHSRRHCSEVWPAFLTTPCPSPTGGYELKILFNGAHRRVVIDDLLPFHPNGSRMCMTSTGKKDIDIWPSLVEKAYLKLMGGYDFPGSNSSADIHALAGWIPDYIEVKSPSFQREQTWSRLCRGFNEGQCILTVGTDTRPIADRGRVKFLPSHCYAVIETEGGSRWLTILDAWVPPENSTEVDDLLDDLTLGDEGHKSIEIAWDDVCALFGSVCVSWNPVIFKNSLVYHGVWRAGHLSPERREESVHCTLRLQLERTKDLQRPLEEVWILLTRHRIDTRRSSEFISLHAELDDGHLDVLKSLTDTAKTRGIYTDNPHVLVRASLSNLARVAVTPSDALGTISLTLSYDGSFNGIGFTVTAYSGFDMRWDEQLHTLPFDLRISGALTAKTSGGNYTLSTYMINPQYRLRVPATTQDGPSTKTRVEISLHALRDLPINAMVTWGQGRRVFALTQSDIIATSGAYTYGFARLYADLPQGDFTLVISAFLPTHLGEFSLLVCSTRWIEVDPIPQEGAGMFAKTIRGEWCVPLTTPPPPVFPLCDPCLPPLSLVAQSDRFPDLFYDVVGHMVGLTRAIPSRCPRPQMSSKLFPATGTGALASSGAFTNARSGAATSQVALRAGQYIIEPAVDGIPGADGTFSLMVYSSSAGTSITPL